MILAGGISSRMRRSLASSEIVDPKLHAESETRSKAMLSVGEGGRPFLDYLLSHARLAGYDDVVLVIGESDSITKKYYGEKDVDNDFEGVRISYGIQPIPDGRTKPLGTADAVLRGLAVKSEWITGSFTVCNSDNLYSIQALRLMNEIDSPFALVDYDRSGLIFDLARIREFAVVNKDHNGFLTDIIEKPTPEEVAMVTDVNGRVGVSMNIFRISASRFRPYLEAAPLHSIRQEKELPVAVRIYIADHPQSFRTIPLCEHVPDLTSREDIPVIRKYLREQYPNSGSTGDANKDR